MRRQLEGIQARVIADGALRFGLAALGMGLVILVWLQWAAGLNAWLVGLGGVTLGGLAYGILLILLRVDEVRMVLRFIRKK